MSTPTQKIFLSYSRADGAAFALRLAADLQEKGFDVWIDQEDIKAGLKWDTEIEKALESCDCLLFIETEKSVLSPNVLDEVYYALDQSKKVIPLIVVDAKTPFRLQRLQHIDFSKNYEAGLKALLNNLDNNVPANHSPGNELTTLKSPHPAFFVKRTTAFALAACLVVMGVILALLVLNGKKQVAAQAKNVVVFADTTTNAGMVAEVPGTAAISTTVTRKQSNDANASSHKRSRASGKAAMVKKLNTVAGTPETGSDKPNEKLDIRSESIAGDWQLMAVEPKAKSHRGYLKIEALGEGRAAIKSYLQFYYPDSKESAYLTIFNAFAGCESCVVNKEMKLKVEDIAVGSHAIKKLVADQPDGGKAGDVILDAHSNKSVGGTATLYFVDEQNVAIKVKQPQTMALANDLVLEPFVYTFRLKKSD